jgi:hypothetical protein
MVNSREPIKKGYANPEGTRELITEGEATHKLGSAQRDQELFDKVKQKNATDTKFEWSAEYVNGKVRVTTKPRA